jgi:large subunit ribosomal protein L1
MNQDEDETLLEDEAAEMETDTAEVRPAEESAVNTDNDTAQEATAAESVQVDEPAIETKHKNRESTSEKAKKAKLQAQEAPAKVEEMQRKLDPLRLRGKKYRAVRALVELNKLYSIEEGIELVKKTSITKFDASVELHCKIKGESLRGTIVLPHGSGKTRRVAVADDETIEQIAAGKLEFDVLIATPAQMPKLAKYAKILGPKGQMPSPKAGTVTDDPEKIKTEISGGRVEYRTDRNGVVHMSIGKVSFTDAQLLENYRTLEAIFSSRKPQSLTLASTMGPGIKIALTK